MELRNTEIEASGQDADSEDEALKFGRRNAPGENRDRGSQTAIAVP